MKNLIFYFGFVFLFLFNIKVYSQYIPDWIQTFHPAISTSFSITETALDPASNIYIGGNFSNGSNYDAAILKFNSFGQYQWEESFAGFGTENQAFPLKVLYAPNNYIYLIGYCENWTVYSKSIFLMKLDPAGNVINSVVYKRAGTDNTNVKDGVFDNNSNIYLTGDVFNFQIGYDSLLVLKYDPDLNLQWVNTKADTISAGNLGKALKTDTQGNLYIAGQYYKTSYNSDCAVFKYSPSGVLLWMQTYRFGNFNYEDAANCLVFDNNQNIISAGYTRFVNGNDTMVTIAAKINSSGITQWVNTYNTDSNGTEYTKQILYNGNFYISIYTFSGTRLIKVNDNGSLLWNRTVSGNVNYNDYDISGNILFTGYQAGSGFNPLLIARINQNGIQDQTFNFSYNGSGTDNGFFLKQYPDSKILSIGLHDYDLLFIKLQPAISNNITISRNGLNKPIIDSNYTYDTIIVGTQEVPQNSIIKDVNITIDTILLTAN